MVVAVVVVVVVVAVMAAVVVVVEGRTCKNFICIRFCLLRAELTVTSLPRSSTVEIYKVNLRSSISLRLCLYLIRLLLQKKEVSEICPYIYVCIYEV